MGVHSIVQASTEPVLSLIEGTQHERGKAPGFNICPVCPEPFGKLRTGYASAKSKGGREISFELVKNGA